MEHSRNCAPSLPGTKRGLREISETYQRHGHRPWALSWSGVALGQQRRAKIAINFDRKMGTKEAQLRAQREAKYVDSPAHKAEVKFMRAELKAAGIDPKQAARDMGLANRSEVEALQAEVARLKRALAERGREAPSVKPPQVKGPQGEAPSCPVCEARRMAKVAAQRARRARASNEND